MQLLIATQNRHKRAEFAAIFPGHDVITPADLGIDFAVKETGDSFLANAMLKAQHLSALIRSGVAPASPGDRTAAIEESIVIADDSGLCVDALAGAPGIYSARFGSPDGGVTELDAASRNELLLHSLEGAGRRTARFVCCMAALLPRDRIVIAQESWEGEIARSASRGTGGFGYDPVFYLPGLQCTAADLPPAEKNRLSHRGRASQVLATGLAAALELPA